MSQSQCVVRAPARRGPCPKHCVGQSASGSGCGGMACRTRGSHGCHTRPACTAIMSTQPATPLTPLSPIVTPLSPHSQPKHLRVDCDGVRRHEVSLVWRIQRVDGPPLAPLMQHLPPGFRSGNSQLDRFYVCAHLGWESAVWLWSGSTTHLQVV